jgi:Rrf2 family iron-sulfur cluster assembly transcriptional regulator
MISDTSRYALRALVCLARAGGGQKRIQARELSTLIEVPEAYLSKILVALSRARMVQGMRGAGGGYRLAKPPAKIHLIQVVELFEGVRTRPVCLFGGDRRCSDDNACTAHDTWKQVWQTYTDFLEQTSLAQLGEPLPEGELSRFLLAKARKRRTGSRRPR